MTLSVGSVFPVFGITLFKNRRARTGVSSSGSFSTSIFEKRNLEFGAKGKE